MRTNLANEGIPRGDVKGSGGPGPASATGGKRRAAIPRGCFDSPSGD